jgi:hypothetical protein
MPTEAASIIAERRLRLAGDVLWLGIAAVACAVIVGTVCWSFSAELSPGAASARPTAAASPSLTFGTNNIPASGPSSTTAGEITQGSSNVPTASIAALTEPAAIKSPLRDPIADQLQTAAPAHRDALAPPPSGPQPAQAASASPPSHGRPLQHHQRTRPAAPGTGTELAPW